MIKSSGNFNGLRYRSWKPSVASNVNIFIAQGSGRFSTQSDYSDLDNFIDLDTYAQQAKDGQELPFNIYVLATYKAAGTPSGTNPSQEAIKLNLGDFIASLGGNCINILMGYSYGGELTAGYLTKSLNTGQTETNYKGSDNIHGYVVFCGKAPGSPQYCAHPDKPVFILHGDSDDSVNVWGGRNLKAGLNACTSRTLQAVMVEIPGGEHYDAWQQGFNRTNQYGAQVWSFIQSVVSMFTPAAPPTPIEIPGSLVLIDGAVVAKFDNGTQKVLSPA